MGRWRLDVCALLISTSAAGGCWLTADYDDLLGYRAEVIADHPVVYLRFEESAGPTARDDMRNFDGDYPAAAVDYGQEGGLAGDLDRAIALNAGVAPRDLQGVVMPAGLGFDGNAAFTVEVWASPTVFRGVGHLVDHADYSGETNGWDLRWEQSGIAFERWNNGMTFNGGAFSVQLSPGEYRHVVGVYDGSQLRLYVDGMLQDTSVSTFPITATGAWTIGKQNCNFPCTQNGFEGAIDELAVYDYALSELRIEAHHRIGRRQ